MESQINLSQQCHCSTGGRTSHISTRIRRRQHILIDNLIQIAGKKIKDLLLWASSDFKSFSHRHHFISHRNSTPQAIHIKISKSTHEKRFPFILFLQRSIKVSCVYFVQYQITAIYSVIKIRPGGFQYSIRGFIRKLIYIITVLCSGSRSTQRQVVTPIFAAFREVGNLSLQFRITADHCYIKIVCCLVYFICRHTATWLQVEKAICTGHWYKSSCQE